MLGSSRETIDGARPKRENVRTRRDVGTKGGRCCGLECTESGVQGRSRPFGVVDYGGRSRGARHTGSAFPWKTTRISGPLCNRSIYLRVRCLPLLGIASVGLSDAVGGSSRVRGYISSGALPPSTASSALFFFSFSGPPPRSSSSRLSHDLRFLFSVTPGRSLPPLDMDAAAPHDFATPDFASFLPPTAPEQFLQFPPNSPSSHPFSFGDTPLQPYPPYGFNTPAPTVPTAHPAMDTTGSTPSPRAPFVPASPMTPPLTSLSGSEISGDNMSQGHGWTTTSATPGGRSGYNSGYNSASGYVSGGAGSRSGTGSPGSTNSHSFPGYGSGLVHRSNRGIYTRGMAERAAGHKRRGSTSMRMADEDSYGSDGESELGLSMPTDVVVSRRREEIRRQRIESEQRRRDDLREGFARLKDVLPVSNQKGSKMALLDRATSHIRYLEALQQQMQSKLTTSEMEVTRLRQINEALMLKAAERRSSQSPL
ncbi:hypothetical protein FS749_005303 [Ceratobasidium sp. UAMH 11750]|nr:hypothetical protein FS749_005303 [Ceratobasidium sp. UAMH 11750]